MRPYLVLLLDCGSGGSGRLRGYPLGDPATSTQDLDLGFEDLGTPEFSDALAALFVRLCEAMDAAWGCVATPETLRHFWLDRWRQARKTGTMANLQKAPGGSGFEQAVQDVFWLNYFGPAFVDRWGERSTAWGCGRWRRPTGGGWCGRVGPGGIWSRQVTCMTTGRGRGSPTRRRSSRSTTRWGRTRSCTRTCGQARRESGSRRWPSIGRPLGDGDGDGRAVAGGGGVAEPAQDGWGGP